MWDSDIATHRRRDGTPLLSRHMSSLNMPDGFGIVQVFSKPGLVPDGRGVFLKIQQLQGCLSRFRNAL
jgi:hypothetical protein